MDQVTLSTLGALTGRLGVAPRLAMPELASREAVQRPPPPASAGSPTSPLPTMRPGLPELLTDLGLPADGAGTALAEALLAQGEPVRAEPMRALRRQLVALGGSPRDAAPLVLLSKLGLPATPRTVELARYLLTNPDGPRATWAEALGRLEQLARTTDDGNDARLAGQARTLLADWTPPSADDPPALAGWLRRVTREVATPKETELLHFLEGSADGDLPPTDARTRLRALGELLERAEIGNGSRPPEVGARLVGREPRAEARGMVTHAPALAPLERLQTAIEAEQLVNAGRPSEAEPRFFVVTLPLATPGRHSAVELSVRERSAEGGGGTAHRPDVVQLRLNLPSLGELRVSLTVSKPSIACQFAAERPFAAELLEAGASELVGGLHGLGYGSATVDASCRPLGGPANDAEPGLGGSGRIGRLDVLR